MAFWGDTVDHEYSGIGNRRGKPEWIDGVREEMVGNDLLNEDSLDHQAWSAALTCNLLRDRDPISK